MFTLAAPHSFTATALLLTVSAAPVVCQQGNIPAGALAQTPVTLEIDASAPRQPVPSSSLLPMGKATNPAGHSITREIVRVVTTQVWHPLHPVGKAAVANLGVRPGTDSYDHE